MIDASIPSARPTVSVEQTLASIKDAIENLKKEREWIIGTYATRISEIEDSRDKELTKNLADLKALGVVEEEIPFRPVVGHKYRKLTHKEILEKLSRLMEIDKDYTAKDLREVLKISYPDWRIFLAAHSDWLVAIGSNKGRKYKRKQL